MRMSEYCATEKTAREKSYPHVLRYYGTSPEYPITSGCPLDAWSSRGVLKYGHPKIHHTSTHTTPITNVHVFTPHTQTLMFPLHGGREPNAPYLAFVVHVCSLGIERPLQYQDVVRQQRVRTSPTAHVPVRFLEGQVWPSWYFTPSQTSSSSRETLR